MSERSVASPPKPGLYSRLFARFYDRSVSKYEAYIEPRKRELFADVEGTVVEIGAGTGANLKFLPDSCRWIGVEPNIYMHEQLLEKAQNAGIEAEIHTANAAGFDVDDAVADVVVSTLVLCSVPDVDQVMSEIRRVLKPGGRFLFIEHVAARTGTTMRRMQGLVFPVWYLCGDGCRVNRETDKHIRQAGFSSLELESFNLPNPPGVPWISPHIIGSAYE